MHYDTKMHNEVNDYINGIDVDEVDPMNAPFLSDDVQEVFKVIKLNAMGPDDVSPYFLKNAPDSLIVLFTKLFNYSWVNHVLPQQWRQANVCVLLKKDAPVDDISSYRPISLTSVVVKSMERLVLNRMMARVKDKLINTQAGFRPRHCCTDQIYQLLSAIKSYHHTHKRNSNKPFYAAFIDFSKAFDRVWTNGLLMKIHKMGIKGHAYQWIKSFLTDRSLRVINGNTFSDWYNITAGVPQGSVISPLLFVIFINDLSTFINQDTGGGSYCLKFADDVVVWHMVQTPAYIIYCIEAILKWCHLWKMVVNSSKSNIVPFTTGNRKWANVKDKDEYIPIVVQQQYDNDSNPQPREPLRFHFVDRYKYLGVTLHHHLQWTPHVLNVIKKANQASALVCRLINVRRRQAPGFKTIRLLTRMIVYTTIGYAMPLWNMTKLQCTRLLSIVTRPIRLVLGLPRTSHYRSILVEVGLPNIQSYRMMNTIMFYRRIRELPATHSIHTALQEEGWHYNEEKKHYVVNPKSIISKSLINTIKHHKWNDDVKRGVTIHDMKQCDRKLLTSRAILKSGIHRSYKKCRNENKSKHISELWDAAADPDHKMAAYLNYDNMIIYRHRARMRFDRTLLRDALQRHGGLRDGITNNCPLCNEVGDDINHYLFHCQHVDMMNARQECFDKQVLYFPAITSAVKPIYYRL
jgi:hypothetical protein